MGQDVLKSEGSYFSTVFSLKGGKSMKLKQYSIYQISARTILNCARNTEDGYRF